MATDLGEVTCWPLDAIYTTDQHVREINHMCLAFRAENRKRPWSSCLWQALINQRCPPPARSYPVLGA